jgi:hypothetical protein
MTPLESSSGEYSGGSAAHVSLDAATATQVAAAFTAALADAASHQTARAMMTGYVQVDDRASGERGVVKAVLQARSPAKQALEAVLKAAMSNNA